MSLNSRAFSVAMCDGGGGAVDLSTLLSISEVVDLNTEEQSTRVLYAAMIDKNDISTQIDELYALTSAEGNGVTSSTLIGENDSLMSLTNSNRFYNGEDAKAQFTAMGEVNTKINDLLSKIDAIYNNKETILNKIDAYNERLLELKKDCRLKLLRDAADVWNHEKHDQAGSPEIKERKGYNPPGPKTEFGWASDEVTFEEAVKLKNFTKKEYPASSYARGQTIDVTYVQYEWHKYKIIKYWKGFRLIKILNDPGFEEVEQMFADVGATLPYDPTKILPKAEEE
ncbi:MAG: hypothetical protein IJ463_01705 [Bacilli bacterium]|nr:hypothetical protein [Bacilli bacterium]